MGKLAGQLLDNLVTRDNSSRKDGVSDVELACEQPRLSATLYRSFDEARSDWEQLLAQDAVSPYQSFEFLSAWSETVGKAHGVEPMLVGLRDAGGRCVALLPFAIDRRGPLRVASFLGGRDSNFNLGLFRHDEAPGGELLLPLLGRAARMFPDAPDLYDLRNQPYEYGGVPNPLNFGGSRPSPSDAYGARLPSDPAELSARMSKDARKKLRRKEGHLCELGEVRYEHNVSGARAAEIADVLLAQKSIRLGSGRIASHFTEGPFKEFLNRMLSRQEPRCFEVHALSVSGKIVAAYAGVVDGKRFSAMLNSYDMAPQFARCSPGDLLLHALMHDLASRGFTSFDLGIGEARYKNAVCDERLRLFDTIVPVTWKGFSAAPIIDCALYLKRKIKKRPALTMFILRARAYLKI
jgi:CelD/BcsL family acetyltransferase involved in cellulose biosynthesis